MRKQLIKGTWDMGAIAERMPGLMKLLLTAAANKQLKGKCHTFFLAAQRFKTGNSTCGVPRNLDTAFLQLELEQLHKIEGELRPRLLRSAAQLQKGNARKALSDGAARHPSGSASRVARSCTPCPLLLWCAWPTPVASSPLACHRP